ncbi:break repair meiotic recombinase recruitment factor 1 isoform X2 [Vicugna pacos]|uniref:Break repair meiotic recombinase recruitment factor 1 isoform X2 n=1 Tax=Vicugna pacos TaxID=30538 RepID=A0ABM5C4S7_VICPA
MSKRKKLRTSGGEGTRPLKFPKNPRRGDSDRAPQNSTLGHLHHPEESAGRSGPAPSAEQSREEPGQAAPSSPDKEAGAPSRLPGQPEKEPVPFPPSQNSVGRFVPQFAKPRKIMTRQAERREEDLRSGAFSSETLPEPSDQQAGSQPQKGSPGLSLQEARDPGDQTQADGTCPEPNGQNPVMPVPSSGDPEPVASSNASPKWGTMSSASEGASQDHLSEQGTNVPDGGSTEEGCVPGDHSQTGHLPNSDAEEKEPDQGAPHGGSAQWGAGAGLPEEHQEEGDGILGWDTSGPVLGSAAQGPPDPLQTPSGTGGEAEWSCSSPRHSPLGAVVIADMGTDPAEPEQRAPEVAKPDREVSARVPASPSGKAPDGGLSGALLSCTPLAGETTGGRGEARQEDKPPGDVSGGLAASLRLAREIQEPTIGAGDSSSLAREMGPSVGQTQVPSPDQEGLGDVCALPVPSQPVGEKAAELGSQSHKQDLKGLSLSLGATASPVYREAVDGAPWNAGAHQGSPDTPAGQPEHPPDSSDPAIWGWSPAMELDFLPDSQIQDALEAPGFEAPPEQILQGKPEAAPRLSRQGQRPCGWSHAPGQISTSEGAGLEEDPRLFPAGSGLEPCWPSTSPHADGGPLAKAQPRTQMGIKTCEAARMEDATDTVRGLVIELSSLNRLIMSAHRDLEASKRLSCYWKAKTARKGPAPYTPKGAGNLPRGEQSWRDL